MRITLDPNVLISALIVNGKSRSLLFAIARRKHKMILSKEILTEFAEISYDAKIRRYVSEEDVTRFLKNLTSMSQIIQIKSQFRVISEDPDDDVILHTAWDGRTSYLVSGDRHLLRLKRFRRTRIVTVDEMLDILRSR